MPSYEHYENYWYSFNIGPVHVVSLSSEVIFNRPSSLIKKQNQWLIDDLNNLDRTKYPWVVTMAHRPPFCDSGDDHDDCLHNISLVRNNFEPILYNHGVDLSIWAHEHYYERFLPEYMGVPQYNESAANPYENPSGLIHIITGSSGCQEGREIFLNKTRAISVFRSSDYGYTRMQVFNQSHLYMEQVSDDKNGSVIDSIWVIKDSHGPFD